MKIERCEVRLVVNGSRQELEAVLKMCNDPEEVWSLLRWSGKGSATVIGTFQGRGAASKHTKLFKERWIKHCANENA